MISALVLYAVGAAVELPRVENDLEERVVAAFNDAGIGPVTVSFTGQEGVLTCAAGPVDVSAALLARSRALWGVQELTVDESCGVVGDSADVVSTDVQQGGESDTTTTALPDADTLDTTIASDSQFSTLNQLLRDTGLDATLASAGPLTLFAPTNEAFQSLGPDVVAALGRDPELLSAVLVHHVTTGILLAADLSAGTIVMLDGTSITVDLIGGSVVLTSEDSIAAVVEPDLVAANGVAHAIDGVLLPFLVSADESPPVSLVTASLAGGEVILSGMVATEEQRGVLRSAALAGIAEANLVDNIVVEGAGVVTDAEVGNLAALIGALVNDSVSGTVSITGAGFDVEAVYVDDAARDAIAAAVQVVQDTLVEGATISVGLIERESASEATAGALEADLNQLVQTTPILFDPDSADISAGSGAVLDRVAALAQRIGGVVIEIQGHTDSDGVAARNLTLSERRALAVRSALIDRGVLLDALTAVGFGGTEPILAPDGTEDKAASRRVEFVVSIR